MIPASISAIESAARAAYERRAGIESNPYPCGSSAHRVWANAFAACYAMEAA